MTQVDPDRLADYVGGALDGTPDADAVRGLIATDRRWAEAYAALVAADANVRADLAAYGAPATMPADVAARLDAALRAERNAEQTSEPGPARGASSDAGPGQRRPGQRRPSHAHTSHAAADAGRPPRAMPRPSRPPGRAGRRRRLVIALSAAAAIVAVGLGLATVLPQLDRSGPGATSGAQPEVASQGGATQGQDSGDRASGAVEPPTLATGTDYRPGAFGGLVAFAAPGDPAATAGPKRNPATGEPPAAANEAAVPGELQPLIDPAARSACLAAISAKYGGTVAVLDYARFEGRPALVVVLVGAKAGAGRRWAVVVGPDCGRAGTDERYNGPT